MTKKVKVLAGRGTVLLLVACLFSSPVLGGEKDAVEMVFELEGNVVKMSLKPDDSPSAVDVKRFGGYFTELESIKLSGDTSLLFGYFRHALDKEAEGGLWYANGDELFFLHSGYAAGFFKVGDKVFVYLNRRLSQHEENGVVFEVTTSANKNVSLRETFFVIGRVLGLKPLNENQLLVAVYDAGIEGESIARVDIQGKGFSVLFGNHKYSEPSLIEAYGVDRESAE
jgi:hypothetical protein